MSLDSPPKGTTPAQRTVVHPSPQYPPGKGRRQRPPNGGHPYKYKQKLRVFHHLATHFIENHSQKRRHDEQKAHHVALILAEAYVKSPHAANANQRRKPPSANYPSGNVDGASQKIRPSGLFTFTKNLFFFTQIVFRYNGFRPSVNPDHIQR